MVVDIGSGCGCIARHVMMQRPAALLAFAATHAWAVVVVLRRQRLAR
jgi:hypothetical protein